MFIYKTSYTDPTHGCMTIEMNSEKKESQHVSSSQIKLVFIRHDIDKIIYSQVHV